MSDSSISKIYQFLTQRPNWKEEADYTGDGVIVKSEFREYLTANWDSIGWNGETTNQKDIINEFWKSIDTTQTGKIRGTDKYDKNALNQTELVTMEGRITIYEKVNEFLGNLTKPSIISDSSFKDWQKDVCSDVGALVEKFIKNGGTEEGIEAYLAGDEVKACINRVTAEYCAAEYQAQEMKNLNSQYGYSYENDATLSSIIKNYLNSMIGEISESEIQSTIVKIIDSYMATAGLKEGSVDALKDYGYTPNANSPLNELQKAVLKKTLTNNLAGIKNEPNYAANSDVYDNAVNLYINTIISGARYSDFEDIKQYNLETFKASEIYKTIAKTIEVKNQINDLFESESFLNSLTTTFGTDIKDKIINSETYANLKSDALQKAANGDFNTSNGTLDTAQVSSWVIQELKNKILEFYPSSFEGMELETMNTTYTDITNITIPNKDLESTRKAAKMFCAGINSLGYSEAIKTVFGTSDYATEIDKLSLDGINTKITALKAEISQIQEEKEKEKEENEQKEQNEKICNAAQVISDSVTNVKYSSISAIINGRSSIHTEFGINADGNIVFQEETTTTVYNTLVKKVKEELEKTEEGRTALEDIGGENILERIVQAAWISAYNTYSSSTSNTAANFIATVLDNIKTIMEKLKEKPEYLKAYTEHTAYADKNLTNGLIHYNTKTTLGNDETINYKNGVTIDADGVVHLKNSKDDPDYQITMNELLYRLINKYSYIDSNTITDVFRKAQQEAIQICINNERDCPYGTSHAGGRVEDSDYQRKWGGNDSRKDDNFYIHMDELVQLTLYCFDKLLYASL